MDFGIRELLMLIGVLVFLVVALDGIRRFQQNRKTQLKVRVDRKSHSELAQEYDELELVSSELPNGGARVKVPDNSKRVTPTFSEPLDILMSETGKEFAKTTDANEINSGEGEEEVFDKSEEIDVSIQEELSEVANVLDTNPDHIEESNQPPQAFASAKQKIIKEKPQGDLFKPAEPRIKTEDIKGTKSKPAHKNLPEVVLAINVIAKGEQEIAGQDLLDAAQDFGLRFGEMDIFHRHEQSNGQGNVIFSMANALNPGLFNIDTLPEEHIKGVTFFMRLSQVNKRIFVLELMLDIAKRLANQLNAELRDDTHSVLSSQTVSHYKSRIQEYERQYLGQVLRGDGD